MTAKWMPAAARLSTAATIARGVCSATVRSAAPSVPRLERAAPSRIVPTINAGRIGKRNMIDSWSGRKATWAWAKTKLSGSIAGW